MVQLKPFSFFFFFFFFFFTVSGEYSSESKDEVRVGVVLDLKSPVGRTAKIFIERACRDFYANSKNANYKTKLSLVFRDSQNDSVVAASEALDLMKNEQVQAIIGPQTSSQAKFVIELGTKANVPIISFSATSPSLSPADQTNFFIRTTHDDSFQVKAIADVVKAYGWKDVIPIYEDSEYGNGLIPYLMDAFQEVNTRVPYTSVISPKSNDSEVFNELRNLKSKQTTIFLVHMTSSLGTSFFVQANKAGMMKEGYVWIVTEGLSTMLDPVNPTVMNSMEGVLGLRTPLPKSKCRSDFNIFGMRAYDTVWAVAMAVERAGTAHSSYLKPKTSKIIGVDIEEIGRLEKGRQLLNTLLNTKFEGLSGNFSLVKGQLMPSVFEIFNLVGKKENIIGCWTQDNGLIQDLSCSDKGVNSTFKNKLNQPTWPGNTKDPPKKLKIGVPVRKGFSEYVKVEWKSHNNTAEISGFSIELFKKVLEVLEFPLPYEFVPFERNHHSAGTYNELLRNITDQTYDAVVGDTTIVAERSIYVDFTLPYSESGVSMVVLVKDENKNFWVFLKPMNWNLWLTSAIGFVVIGFVVWVLEHRTNTEFRGPKTHQLGTTLWFSFSTLVFAHREKLKNNLSKFVLIRWIFVVLIFTQSYTASLTSMLTVQRLQPSFDDIKEIRTHGYLIGYPKDSFVKDFLINQLNLNESNLKVHETRKDHDKALSNHSVAAIFDEIPFIKLFLAEYCSKYMMVGPIYKTGGFGFAFPLGSPLVSDISRAILNVTQDKDKLDEIERNTLGRSKTNCEGQDATTTTSSDSLSLYSFGGLFIITGVASLSSLLTFIFYFVRSHWPVHNDNKPEISFWSKIGYLIKCFDEIESREDPVTISPEGNGATTDDDRVDEAGEINVVRNEEDEVNNSPAHRDDTSMHVHNSS